MIDEPQIILVVAGKPYLDITAQLGELYLDSGEPETGVMILDRPYGSVLNILRQSHTLDVEVLQTIGPHTLRYKNVKHRNEFFRQRGWRSRSELELVP